MIADLLPMRLRWQGRRGIASGSGAMMTLGAPPPLGFHFAEIDYAPGICALVRRQPCGPLEDMLPGEIAECRMYLATLDAGPPDLEPDC